MRCSCCGDIATQNEEGFSQCCDSDMMLGWRQCGLYLRLTRKYRDHCKHLDESVLIAHMSEIGRCIINRSEPDEYDAWFTTEIIVRLKSASDTPPKTSVNDIRNALSDHYNMWGCDHEHDCCGCALTRTTEIDHIGASKGWDYWRIETSTCYNI